MLLIKLYLLTGFVYFLYEFATFGYHATVKMIYDHFNGIVKTWFLQVIVLLFFVFVWPRFVWIFVETIPKRVRIMYLLWKVRRIKRKYNL